MQNFNNIECKRTKLSQEAMNKVIGGGDSDKVSTYNDGQGNVGAQVKISDRVKMYGSTNVPGAISGNPRHEAGININLAPKGGSTCSIS